MKTSNNFLKFINKLDGIILQNNFDGINENVPLQNQLSLMAEDMLQIEFENDLILDVGWYFRSAAGGYFITYVIKDCDWDNPIINSSCDL
jgi:hypothetical protein